MAKQLKDLLESFEFNRAALAKQRLQNLRHQGRKVRGARIANLMRAAGLKEEEIDETDLDQLDEVLSADASSEDWIKDFVHSDAPQFQGKSKKERIKMALGAYYAKSRHKDGEGLGEEVEQMEEGLGSVISSAFQKMKSKLKPSTQPTSAPATSTPTSSAPAPSASSTSAPKKPITKSAKPSIRTSPKTTSSLAKQRELAKARASLLKYGTKAPKTFDNDHEHIYGVHTNPTTGDKTHMRGKNVGGQIKFQAYDSDTGDWNDLEHSDDKRVAANAVRGQTFKRKTNEEVEHISELNIDTLKTYIGKAKQSKKFEADTQNTAMRKDDHMMASDAAQKVAKRKEGIKAAKAKLNKEEVEMQEAKDTVTKDASGKVTSWKHEGDWTKANPKKNPEGKVHNLVGQALEKTKQMNKEEFEQFLEEAVKQYAGLEKEDKKGLPTALVKKSDKAVAGDTVEGWDHPHKAVKESYDEEGNLVTMPKTFTEFMEGMIATKVSPGVTRYTGGSYGNAKGAKYGNTDYDKETLDTKDDEGGETQKRGRGRPAGSKSGARGPRIK